MWPINDQSLQQHTSNLLLNDLLNTWNKPSAWAPNNISSETNEQVDKYKMLPFVLETTVESMKYTPDIDYEPNQGFILETPKIDTEVRKCNPTFWLWNYQSQESTLLHTTITDVKMVTWLP